jgi:hypothetical protein
MVLVQRGQGALLVFGNKKIAGYFFEKNHGKSCQGTSFKGKN